MKSTSWFSTLRRRAAQDDGIAIVVAVALIGLVSIIMLAMLSMAMREARMTGRDRQRSSAVMTAEGQVDSNLAQMQQADPAILPCGTSSPTGVGVTPDQLSITTTVTYYDASGGVIDCSAVPTTRAYQAKISSTSVSKPIAGQAAAQRTVETLVRLTPKFAKDLNKAIFGDAGISLSNNGEVFGESGTPDADVYTNGNFSCDNNQRYHGSIYAQGSASLNSSCTVDVDVWTKTGFSANSTGATVSGKVLVSQGNASLVNNATVGQTIRTSGTITWPACTATKCFPGVTVKDPPKLDFPIINWNSDVQAAWADAGYTNVVTITDCTPSSKSNVPGTWIAQNAPSLSEKTILYTPCQVVVNGDDVVLKNDLAVFAAGGISFINSLSVRSTDSTKRMLYLIQPYDSVSTHPCLTEGILLDNRVTVESTVDDLLYSPCNVHKANNSDHYGQIYAGGTAAVDNRLTMYYEPLPMYGIANQKKTVEYYNLDILYKRETH